MSALVLALVSSPASAQDGDSWGDRNVGEVSGIGTWATGLAIGDSFEFTPRYGFIGFNGEVMLHVRPEISIGLSSGYQVFLGQERSTVTLGDAAINAFQFRYLDTVPIFAVGRYFVDIVPELTFSPALGIGAVYTNREIDIGILGVYEDAWHFGVAPQLALVLHTDGPDPLLGVKYTFAPGGSETPTEMWFTAEIGLLFD
jgi:hypothetical protein